jgi:hypothetical protein
MQAKHGRLSGTAARQAGRAGQAGRKVRSGRQCRAGRHTGRAEEARRQAGGSGRAVLKEAFRQAGRQDRAGRNDSIAEQIDKQGISIWKKAGRQAVSSVLDLAGRLSRSGREAGRQVRSDW